MREPIANQGEIRVDRIADLPDCDKVPFSDKIGEAYVISHSEQGNHHILDGDVEVLERTSDVPQGASILYAIVKAPTALRQDAPVPHLPVELEPGLYEFRIKRMYDSFAEQARRVAD